MGSDASLGAIGPDASPKPAALPIWETPL